jgi:hypothetical protein
MSENRFDDEGGFGSIRQIRKVWGRNKKGPVRGPGIFR